MKKINKTLRIKNAIKKYVWNHWFHIEKEPPFTPLIKADEFVEWLKKYHI